MMSKAAKKAKAAMTKVHIPKADPAAVNGSSPQTPKTPKTPADEGIDFFESAAVGKDQPIRVYELRLDPDGGPNKDRAVRIVCSTQPQPGYMRIYLHESRSRCVMLKFHSVYASSSGICPLRRTRFLGCGYSGK